MGEMRPSGGGAGAVIAVVVILIVVLVGLVSVIAANPDATGFTVVAFIVGGLALFFWS